MEVDLIKTLSKFGEEFDVLLANLNALTILDDGEKLSIYDNVLYIDGTWYLSIQRFTRFILNQGRTHIYNYLKNQFANYEILLNNINSYDSITRYDVELRRELLEKSRIFIANAKMGLLVLKCTYPKYKELFTLIDDFLEKIDTIHLGFSPKMKILSGSFNL